MDGKTRLSRYLDRCAPRSRSERSTCLASHMRCQRAKRLWRGRPQRYIGRELDRRNCASCPVRTRETKTGRNSRMLPLSVRGPASGCARMKDMLVESISRLETWVEARGYKGYEPFDGLGSFLTPLLREHSLAERLLQQAVSRSPLNVRPLLGIHPQELTKGRGFMAWGYLNMFRITGHPTYAEKAAACLSWLTENSSPGRGHLCWGNHYRFTTRIGSIPKLEPIIPWSSLIGEAFLDAYEVLGDERYLEVAESISGWILTLPQKRTDRGACIAYNALAETTVHGANMLGAALLAQTARHTGDRVASQVARDAMTYSCLRQHSDGSWPYADEPNASWIDCFHTGYNLDSLKRYADSTGDTLYAPNLARGYLSSPTTFSSRPEGQNITMIDFIPLTSNVLRKPSTRLLCSRLRGRMRLRLRNAWPRGRSATCRIQADTFTFGSCPTSR